MSVFVYKNTKSNFPGTGKNYHEKQPRGMACTFDNHFIHIYGSSEWFWTLSPGLTAKQKTSGTIEDWIVKNFGAEEIQHLRNSPGITVDSVWRPGISSHDEITHAFGIDKHQQRSAEQALKILVDKLDEIFLYIEPSEHGLETFSHKTRELLILACTELENIWMNYMKIAHATPIKKKKFTTEDYVKLCNPLFLAEYEIRLKPYSNIQCVRPFQNWNIQKPTQSLSWYEAYNKTKHDRASFFQEATLFNCIQAIAANIVLFCVQYGPYVLFRNTNSLSAIMNQLFELHLFNPDPSTFYFPKMAFINEQSQNCIFGNLSGYIQPWQKVPLTL